MCSADLGNQTIYSLLKTEGAKKGLKELYRNHFAHISAKIEATRVELKRGQVNLHDRPNDVNLKMEFRKFPVRAVFLIDAERKFFAQKTKCEFFLQGDKNTRLFHSLVKRNAKRNYIASLAEDDGTSTTSIEEMQGELLKFYGNLLGTWHETEGFDEFCMNSGPKISSIQAASLVDTFTKKDVKEASFDIGNDKLSRPDGYTSCYFKKAWNLVGDDLYVVVLEFFDTG